MATKKSTTKNNEVKKTKKIDKVEEEKINDVTPEKNAFNTILVVGAIIIVLIALIVSSNNSENSNSKSLSLTEIKCDNETDSIEQDEDSNLNKISCNGYEELVKQENENLILIARPTCGYCTKFIPVLEEIIDEYNITINYFDTDSLTDNESKQFYNSSSLYSSDDFGTPTLIITSNNEIKKYSIGYKDKDNAIKWLKDNGIITE